MNYQEFIKNIYTSLKAINLKHQQIDDNFQNTFKRLDTLENNINSLSEKICDFIESNKRIKTENEIEITNSFNNINNKLTSILSEQIDILNTISDTTHLDKDNNIHLDEDKDNITQLDEDNTTQLDKDNITHLDEDKDNNIHLDTYDLFLLE
jgi:hypothetical protein